MKLQYDHILLDSFKEWFDHTLLHEGQAYRNVTSGQFYKTNDKQFRSYDVFVSPYHQIVYDVSVSGANVPSGVYVDNVFVARGTDGLKIDFNRGRAIFDNGSYDSNDVVKANYAVKEFNIYIATEPDEKLLFETKFDTRPLLKVPTTGISPNSVVVPGVFITLPRTYNAPYALGGADLTTSKIRCIVFAGDMYSSVGIKSLFRDKNNTTFCKLSNTPINEFGDIKSGNSWDYTQSLSADQYAISSVTISSLENDLIAQHHPKLHVSILEFEVIKSRFPRL